MWRCGMHLQSRGDPFIPSMHVGPLGSAILGVVLQPYPPKHPNGRFSCTMFKRPSWTRNYQIRLLVLLVVVMCTLSYTLALQIQFCSGMGFYGIGRFLVPFIRWTSSQIMAAAAFILLEMKYPNIVIFSMWLLSAITNCSSLLGLWLTWNYYFLNRFFTLNMIVDVIFVGHYLDREEMARDMCWLEKSASRLKGVRNGWSVISL